VCSCRSGGNGAPVRRYRVSRDGHSTEAGLVTLKFIVRWIIPKNSRPFYCPAADAAWPEPGQYIYPRGSFNVTVNLIVALAKMLLVTVFFMHLRGASPLLRIISVSFVWLLVQFVLSPADYLSRIPLSSPW
jgi:Prokaryotic Cytochrome C oxidase subunit IV